MQKGRETDETARLVDRARYVRADRARLAYSGLGTMAWDWPGVVPTLGGGVMGLGTIGWALSPVVVR